MAKPLHLAQYIDHTLLRPDASREEIQKLCDEALEFSFKGVCVEMKWLEMVIPILNGRSLPVTVISFPGGNDPTATKVKQTLEAVSLGAKEIDMVLNRDLLKQKKYSEVFHDIEAVVKAAKVCPVKVILETSELTQTEKILACGLASAGGAHFVKTSTGFSKSGAHIDDIRLMREVVGTTMGIKASGGIRTYDDAVKMIEAGATRIGASASVSMVKAERER